MNGRAVNTLDVAAALLAGTILAMLAMAWVYVNVFGGGG
jgi:hypothetical protein